ncbi:hypothetical protein EDB83DRAFT_2322277 [Lactarius deliciosus]|nr:hypothetical protein EDB83DRAFT_2322277 [Lactarius deliciosus]
MSQAGPQQSRMHRCRRPKGAHKCGEVGRGDTEPEVGGHKWSETVAHACAWRKTPNGGLPGSGTCQGPVQTGPRQLLTPSTFTDAIRGVRIKAKGWGTLHEQKNGKMRREGSRVGAQKHGKAVKHVGMWRLKLRRDSGVRLNHFLMRTLLSKPKSTFRMCTLCLGLALGKGMRKVWWWIPTHTAVNGTEASLGITSHDNAKGRSGGPSLQC